MIISVSTKRVFFVIDWHVEFREIVTLELLKKKNYETSFQLSKAGMEINFIVAMSE